MKKRYIWLLMVACLLFVGLSAFTIYLSIKTSEDLPKQIERSLVEYRIRDTALTNHLIGNAVSQTVPISVVGEQGAPGPKGDTVVGPRGDTVIGPQGPAGVDGKGERGDPGIPGREIELSRDPLSGDLQWRYTGDDFWTVLVEGCELKNECEAS